MIQTLLTEDATSIFIDGAWRNAELSTASINPADKSINGYFSEATIDHVNLSIKSAKNSFNIWKKETLVNRAKILKQIVYQLEKDKHEIATMITKEMGKPLREALGEVEVAIQTAEYFMGEGKRMMGEVIPSSNNSRHIHTVRSPVGVVGCITPWNYPISLASYKIFSALIAGNTVVWKPSPEVNCTATLFMNSLNEAGLPAGVVNLITGTSPKLGEHIVQHSDVPLLTFTGSTNVGKIIAEQAAKNLKRVTLELGGNNAAIVMDDANLELAAAQIVASGFGTSGQRCTATRRVFVHQDVKELLLEKIVKLTENLVVGNGLDDMTSIGPIINEISLNTIDQAVKQAIEEGAEIVIGGKILDKNGYYYAPTILDEVTMDHHIAGIEVFGPVLSIISFNKYDDAINWNNATEFGLSTAIFTTSLSTALKAQCDIESGLIYINAGTANAEMGVPFGGMKNSGNGEREVSHHMLNFMTEIKSVYINYEG